MFKLLWKFHTRLWKRWSSLAADNLTSSSSMVLFDWLKTGHFAASFWFKSSEEQRCVNVSAWHASLFVCLSQCCVGGCVNLKCFCYSACVCVTDTESVCRSLSVRACVWLWLHDNINSLSSFVTIRLYLNRINHTSHVWHAHVHLAFDSADTYMCRPTCETLASSSRELCSHNNGQQWEQ